MLSRGLLETVVSGGDGGVKKEGRVMCRGFDKKDA
jgi:hypothetical protein